MIATAADTTAPVATTSMTRLRGYRSERYPIGYWVAAAPKTDMAINTPTWCGAMPILVAKTKRSPPHARGAARSE
ncbi:MAG: hypothetical protein V3S38_07895 [Acidimicrobiia bacterium]